MFRGGDPYDSRVLGDAHILPSYSAIGASNREADCAAEVAARYAQEFNVRLAVLRCSSRWRALCRIRGLIAERLVEHHVATLSEAARIFNRAPSTLCSAMNRYRSGGSS